MAAEQGELLRPGQAFGAYRVVRRLGRGGMGFVYLLESPDGGQFAVKIIDPVSVAKEPEYVARFAHEGDFAMKIRHPNMIAVHEMGQDPDTGYYFLVMDYVPNGDVYSRLVQQGPFDIDEAVRLVAQIASALVEVHAQGVVHRDIKPSNIMFAADGTPKLADLGIAKFSDAGASILTSADVMIGTPAYMAPEQIMDSHGVDARADVYSLGVVFFEMLTGHRPNEGLKILEIVAQAVEGRPIPDVRTFRPEIPATIAQLLNMMCAPKREQRLASARQVVDVFNRILQRERGAAPLPHASSGKIALPASSSSKIARPAASAGGIGRAWSRLSSLQKQLLVAGCGVAGIVVLASCLVPVLGRMLLAREESEAAAQSATEPEITPLPGAEEPETKPGAALESEPSSPPENPEAKSAPAPEAQPAPAPEAQPAPAPEVQPAPAPKAPSAPEPKVEAKQNSPAPPKAAPPPPQAKAPPPPKSGEEKVFVLNGGVPVKMVYCAPGTFTMGSPVGEPGRKSDEQAHEVTLTRGFWIGKYEVTREQWRRVMGVSAPGGGTEDHPVTSVSWHDCQNFLGRTGKGFRLPTEAEWEYACRAGSSSAFAAGTSLGNMGWFIRTGGGIQPVGGKAPNKWNLHDMHGNVWEWCADWYGAYPQTEATDPAGAQSGTDRVMRGGWANSLESKCRSAGRSKSSPQDRSPTCGFRLCRTDDR